MGGDTPVVLEVRFQDLVAEVILGLAVRLRESVNIAEQKIRESVAGETGRRVAAVEGQRALDGAEAALFIFLGDNSVGAQLQGVPSGNLSYIVTHGVRGVGIVPGNVSLAFCEISAVGGCVPSNTDIRQLVAEIRK